MGGNGGDDRLRVPARIGNWFLKSNLGSVYSGEFGAKCALPIKLKVHSGSVWDAENPFTRQLAAMKVQIVAHECPTNRYARNFYPSLSRGGKGKTTLRACGIQGDFDQPGVLVSQTRFSNEADLAS